MPPIESTKPAPGGIFLSESASLPEGNLPSDVSFITSVSLTAYPSLTGASTEGNPSLSRETAFTSGLLSEGILTSHETSDGLVTPSELVEAPSDGKAGVTSTTISTDADRVSQESQAQTEDHIPFGGSTQTRTSSLIQDASTLLDTDSSADISLVTSEIPGSSVKTEFQGFPTGAPASDVLKHPSGDIPLPSTPTSAVTLSDELSTASEVSEASFSLPGKPLADTTNSLSGPEITIPAESSNVLASGTPSGSTPSAVASPDPTEDVSASGTLAGPSSMVSDASVATSTDISPDMTSPVVPTADTSVPAEGSDDSQTGIITHSDSVEPSRLHANETSPTGATSHLRSQSTDTLPPLDTTILIHVNDFADEADINPRGRAIVQYQPGDTSDCDTKAKWRIFFEKQGVQDSQWCDPSDDKKLRARAACEISATASLPSLPTLIAEAEPTQPTTPFTDTGRMDCYDADSFSHQDTTSTVFVEVTEKFCKSLEGIKLNAESDDIYELYEDSTTGEQYAYTVSWVCGCVTDQKSQELTDPTEMGSPNCREMFGSVYHFCNEDGPHLGGTSQFGCVQYDVKAGWTGDN
ncbi:hypothetical protein FOZG_16017 [Fusarium oxysporum Fo47]|uniref:Uncharacterized protein n=1 Tax=Fusarium oxysporum Fo47 TaxID=660027 RepID=W9JMB8_FUSOX|nr:hypothetical protein FOZG_16017 [Fusarium oxysporum Fo47]